MRDSIKSLRTGRKKGRRIKMRLLFSFGVIYMLCCFTLNCSSPGDTSVEQARDLYIQDKLEDALPLLQQVTSEPGAGAEDFAYLAETHRRLGDKENALKEAANALQIDSCNSFAHMALSYLYNPMYGDWAEADRDKAWHHIQQGIECDPGDGNIWLAAWTEAIFKGDKEIESRSLRMMIGTGFLTPAILAYNRWMLQHLPQNAILLTNGDMDTYPAVALQETENFRTDVIVINYSLLNTRWYQKHLQDRYGLQFPLTDNELDNLYPAKEKDNKVNTVASQIMKELCAARTKGEFEHPVAISITVLDLSFIKGLESHIILKGAYNLLASEPADINYDIEAVKTSLESLNINDFTGPFAGEMDRSPVRRSYTRSIASNFPNLAILVIEKYSASDRIDEALEMQDWAEQMEKSVIKDPEIDERLKEIRKSITEKTG
jgi:tetratricopeptide (TPR) repeat protein